MTTRQDIKESLTKFYEHAAASKPLVKKRKLPKLLSKQVSFGITRSELEYRVVKALRVVDDRSAQIANDPTYSDWFLEKEPLVKQKLQKSIDELSHIVNQFKEHPQLAEAKRLYATVCRTGINYVKVFLALLAVNCDPANEAFCRTLQNAYSVAYRTFKEFTATYKKDLNPASKA
jgi:hypothetical protein